MRIWHASRRKFGVTRPTGGTSNHARVAILMSHASLMCSRIRAGDLRLIALVKTPLARKLVQPTSVLTGLPLCPPSTKRRTPRQRGRHAVRSKRRWCPRETGLPPKHWSQVEGQSSVRLNRRIPKHRVPLKKSRVPILRHPTARRRRSGWQAVKRYGDRLQETP